MPSKRKSSGGKEAASEPAAATRRSTRGASASNAGTKRKASPSPAPRRAASAKKGRTKSPSPSPAPSSRESSRGRSATAKKEETKPSGRAASQKGRVTRAVVQEKEEVKKSTSRSTSKGSKTPTTPKQAATPKKAAAAKGRSATPKGKAETPKQKASASRSKSATPKQAAVTPKRAASTPKQRSTPKQKAAMPKRTPTPKKKETTPKQPAKRATPKASPKKTESPSKPARSSRRSRAEAEPVEEKPDGEEKTAEDETEPEAPIEETKEETADVEETGTEEAGKDENPEEENVEDIKADEVEEAENKVGDALENEKVDDTEDAEKPEEEEEEKLEVPEETEKANEEQIEEEENIEQETEEPEDTEEQMETDEKEPDEEEENVEQAEENVEQVEENVDQEQENVEQAEEDVDQAEVEQSGTAEKEEEPVADETVEELAKEENENEEAQLERAVEEEGENGESVNEDSVESVESSNNAGEETSDHAVQPSEDVVELNKEAGDPAVMQEESAVVNDSLNENSGDGSGEPENAKKVTVVEEISDDDILEINTNEPTVQDHGSNGDIEDMENQVNDDGNINVSSSPGKRKIDEVDRETTEEGSPTKKARMSTEEAVQENGSSTQDDIAKDYVIIEMEDVPQADSDEVQKSLPNPVFNRVMIPNPGFSGIPDTKKQFSVVSYNMLADCHLFRNDYSFTEDEFLKPEYRLKKVLEELRYLDGDVICMQEVDPNYFAEQLLPGLRSLGYEGVHKERQGGEYYFEGEATFYKTSRFTLMEASSAAFSELVEKEFVEGTEPTLQEAVRSYMNLPDVLIVTKLKCNHTDLEVTIGNVHIQWGEMKVPDAQCVQIASAVKEVVSRASGDNFPHIICGDFNSPPMSPGYLVARDGYPSGDETINKLMKIEGLELPDGKRASLVNSLWPAFQHTSSSLRSAYSEAQGYEPEITSFNRVMCDCVDYVFYSSMSLENVGVLQTPSKERIMETGGIPDCFFPSDHVSLKAVLAFK